MHGKTMMPWPLTRKVAAKGTKKGLVCAVKCNEKATTKMEEYDEDDA